MDPNAQNRAVVESFRAHGGHPEGFGDIPVIVVHHVGRTSGKTYETPLTYQPGPGGRMYLFGAFRGAAKDPQWVENLRAAGRATVEVGDEVVEVTVTEVVGAERDEVFERQKATSPDFATYEARAAASRVIPVLRLNRVA